MEAVVGRRASETGLTFLLSDGCLVRLTTELNFPPYIDAQKRPTHTPAHCRGTEGFVKRPGPIASETEFQEWLVAVLESERERLREEAAARECQKHVRLERLEKDAAEETRYENEL